MEGPTTVRVLVLRSREGIMDLDALDIHGVIFWWRNGCDSTSPILCSYGFVGITSVPETKTDFHRSLRVVLSCLSWSEGTNCNAIDGPNERGGRPVQRVGVELRLWIIDRNIFGDPIIVVAFAEVVRLNFGAASPGTLPVYLIEVIRQQNHATDYAFSLRRLNNIFDTTKEEFEV